MVKKNQPYRSIRPHVMRWPTKQRFIFIYIDADKWYKKEYLKPNSFCWNFLFLALVNQNTRHPYYTKVIFSPQTETTELRFILSRLIPCCTSSQPQGKPPRYLLEICQQQSRLQRVVPISPTIKRHRALQLIKPLLFPCITKVILSIPAPFSRQFAAAGKLRFTGHFAFFRSVCPEFRRLFWDSFRLPYKYGERTCFAKERETDGRANGVSE